MNANGPEEVPGRLEALAALAGMPRAAVHAQLRGALQVVVHVTRTAGVRRAASVGVLGPDPDDRGAVRVLVALTSGSDGLRPGPGLGALLDLVPTLRTPAEVSTC